jgi:uncharacterized protein
MVTKTWEEYYGDILQLSRKVKDSGFKPDIIAPCLLGGAFPGMVLAKEFKLKAGSYRPVDIVRDGEKRLLAYDIQGPVVGSKILIVEDDIPTGKGILFIKRELENRGVGEVRVAAVYVTPQGRNVSDYFVEVHETINYPWKQYHSGNRM